MKYRRLDAAGDYSFGSGNRDFLQDTPETVAQAVLTRLRLFRAEWFLDTEEGTPYQAAILGKNNKSTADAALRERILGTQGVEELTAFDSVLDVELRTLSVSATIETIYGPAQINEIL